VTKLFERNPSNTETAVLSEKIRLYMKKTLLIVFATIFATVLVNAQADSTLKVYTGKYIFPAGSPTPEATISLDGGTMYISSSMGSATLAKVDGDVFSIVEYNGTATFKRNEQGKVVSVLVAVAGMELVGTKEETALFWWRPNLLFKY
jgi:hypothetical protein